MAHPSLLRRALFAACLAMVQKPTLAVPPRHEAAAFAAPIYGKLSADGKSYTFFSALGGTALYRYTLNPRLWLEIGYEAQSSGNKVLFHGPELAVAYAFFGRPSVEISEEPISLQILYPFEAHAGFGTWVREYDFSGIFPASAGLFTSTQNLLKKGNLVGAQGFLGMAFEFNANLRLVGRLRYLSGLTPGLVKGSVDAFGVQLGSAGKL